MDTLINLENLYLDANEITEIKCLDKLLNLEGLYLDTKKITEIETSGLEKLDKLKLLYLGLNPLGWEAKKFGLDFMGVEHVKQLLIDYKECKGIS